MTTKQYKELLKSAKKYIPESNIEIIEKAYKFAEKAHKGQKRYSKENYITHPLEVAKILVELEQDASTIAAGLMHDILEDCNINEREIKQEFGPIITLLVEGVTKLGKIEVKSKEEAQVENYRKMFLAMAKDLRVIIIKLADRLHNMRTLKFLPTKKQAQIAQETRDIFAPLANKMGMASIKWELEDLSFYYLNQKQFQEIKKLVADRRDVREKQINHFVKKVKTLLSNSNIESNVTGRPKHFYSIFKKLQTQKISFENIYDSLAIRIIVKDIKDCYEVLGLIHAEFRPVDGRFKDYIALPKSNLYQSLHTTVISHRGLTIEIQIRTKDMHHIAEHGIAAHWEYKETATSNKQKKEMDSNITWLRQLIEIQKENTNAKNFLDDLKLDLFMEEVFVFTPKGDVHALQKEATALDFAYKIHTEIGHCYVGAKANGQIVPIHYELKSGDQIEVLTSKKPAPKIDWLKIVKTNQAKSKIKQWFKRQNKTINIEKGKLSLEKTLINLGFTLQDIETKESLSILKKRFSNQSFDDLFLLIGTGELSPIDITTTLKKVLKLEEPTKIPKFQPKKTKKSSQEFISVFGEENIKAVPAKCCNPLPGEPIIGYITKGYGVTAHRVDCKNILNLTKENMNRLVDAVWTPQEKSKKLYKAIIEVEAFDRLGILQEIIKQISDSETNITEINSKVKKDGGSMLAKLTIHIKDANHFNKVKKAISDVKDVISIYRKK